MSFGDRTRLQAQFAGAGEENFFSSNLSTRFGVKVINGKDEDCEFATAMMQHEMEKMKSPSRALCGAYGGAEEDFQVMPWIKQAL